jgi:hypothetical protein
MNGQDQEILKDRRLNIWIFARAAKERQIRMIYKETQAKSIMSQVSYLALKCSAMWFADMGIVSEALPGTLSQWRLCGDGGDWAKIWT